MSGLPLEGGVALVTGASRGIGRGIAVSAAELGADVVVTARSLGTAGDESETLEGTRHLVEGRGRRCVVVGADLTADGQVERLGEIVQSEFGRVDLVVNNAAAMIPGMHDSLFDMTAESWRYQIELNLTVPWLVTKTFASMMDPDGGLVVNVTSMAAGGPRPASLVEPWARVGAAYAASKVALNRLTEDLAGELRDHRIAVVALHPGMTRTENGIRLGRRAGFHVERGHPVEVVVAAFERIVTAPDPMAFSGALVRANEPVR